MLVPLTCYSSAEVLVAVGCVLVGWELHGVRAVNTLRRHALQTCRIACILWDRIGARTGLGNFSLLNSSSRNRRRHSWISLSGSATAVAMIVVLCPLRSSYS